MHEGQQPRDLQENGTRSSSPQLRQQVRTKPSSKSPQPAKPSSSPPHERRQRPRPLLAASQKLREVPTHQHRRVALVGLTRHVAERPRARRHLARLCIRSAARRRSPSRRNRYARRRWSSTWRPAGGPPRSARRTAPPRPRLRARMHRPHRQRLTAAARPRPSAHGARSAPRPALLPELRLDNHFAGSHFGSWVARATRWSAWSALPAARGNDPGARHGGEHTVGDQRSGGLGCRPGPGLSTGQAGWRGACQVYTA